MIEETDQTPMEIAVMTCEEKDSQTARLLSAYQVLFAQRNLDNDVLWRIIAFSVATEAGGLIALLSDKLKSANNVLNVLIGVGLLLVGVVGPLTVRFVETSVMLDRQLLDQYEDVVLHGLRLSDRFEKILPNLSKERQVAANLRRFAKTDSGKVLRTLDRIADLLGQPSLVWTATIASGGAASFGIALSTADVRGVQLVTFTSLATFLTMGLWLLANEVHRIPLRVWRRFRQKGK